MGICIYGKNYIRKSGRNNPGLGIGKANKDGKTKNLGKSIGIADIDWKSDNLNIGINIVNEKTGNSSK